MTLVFDYELRIHEAGTIRAVDSISFDIRSDNRLSNRDRNSLFIVCANRKQELSGKDGSLPVAAGRPARADEAPVPANPGGKSLVAPPSRDPSAMDIPSPTPGELSLSDAKQLWDKFQAFKMAVIERGDFDLINGKKDLNRSGWSKIGTAFGISVEILEREVTPSRVSFRVRASKGSRFADNVGSAERDDIQGEPTFHLIETKAYTRAMKRAIADLVGGAETE